MLCIVEPSVTKLLYHNLHIIERLYNNMVAFVYVFLVLLFFNPSVFVNNENATRRKIGT